MNTAKVKVGSREIAVEQTPLHVNFFFAGGHSGLTLRQTGDDLLRVQQSGVVRVLGCIFFVLGLPVLILGLLAIIGLLLQPTLENALGTLCLMSFGSPFVFIGLKLLGGPRFRFDSGVGELTIRHAWRTRRRPLADIVAVQVIYAGSFGSDENRFISYQLNLVLDDQSEPRLFVAYNRDAADMGTKAKQLAEFLHVPLLAPHQIAGKTQKEGREDADPPTGERSDPTRYWAKSNEPMPPFDLEAGSLGGLTWDVDDLQQAEFLGRPERVEHLERPGDMRLHYVGRGFVVCFMPQFIELICNLAPRPNEPPEPGQRYCRPRLSGGIELTPQMTAAQIRELFGPPKAEYDYPQEKTLVHVYVRGRFQMEFEFEQSTKKLLTWTVPL